MNLQLPTLSGPVALALVAVIAYCVGRRRYRSGDTPAARRELKRARSVIQELSSIARDIRQQVDSHQLSVRKFRKRLQAIELEDAGADSNRDLADEAERLLKPTLALSTQIARAYEELRQQATRLMSFTEVRTDPLTGISNRRALQDTLGKLLALQQRYGSPFSLAIFDIDHFKKINDDNGHLFGDAVLQDVARVFDHAARETDVVTRYGGEEFVIVMPETSLDGASIFAERVRDLIEGELQITISGGVAYASPTDSEQELLSRADEALYEAKSGGRNQIFRHDGDLMTRVPVDESGPNPLQERMKTLKSEADHLSVASRGA